MSTPSAERSLEVQRGAVIAPDQLVSLLVGHHSITLRGFGGIPRDLPFWIPTVSSYAPQLSADANAEAFERSKRLANPARVVVLVASLLLTFWAGSFFGGSGLNSSSVQPSVEWSVRSVGDSGVLVKLGVETISVPMGAMLPNGEILRSVDARRQSFTTDSQISAVKK